MMMFNDGLLNIYRKVVTDDNHSVMDSQTLELVGTAFFGELSFTATEHYGAKQSETEILRKVRIHQDKSICNKHIVGVSGTLYEVGRTFSAIEKGVAITDITLERVTTQYDIAGA